MIRARRRRAVPAERAERVRGTKLPNGYPTVARPLSAHTRHRLLAHRSRDLLAPACAPHGHVAEKSFWRLQARLLEVSHHAQIGASIAAIMLNDP